MNSEQFTYWLKGYFELSDSDNLSPQQVQIIKDHLNLVFTKVTPDRNNETYCSTTGKTNEWWVVSTSISQGWLLLTCKKTGKSGSVRNPTSDEWNDAFFAPENPYRWHDESRVVVDEPDNIGKL